MTNWTLETLEDFEGVFFDAGMGWKVLFEIHLAISVRARYVSGAGTNFNTQISGIVWTDDDVADDNRDLRTELQYCYNAIVAMMDSPQTESGGHHWTHTSGRSEVWTLESMTADIGMGEFEDLLIRTQSPEPLVWLIAALNRMQHLKLWRKLFFNDLIYIPSNINPNNGRQVHMLPHEDLQKGAQTDVHDDIDVRLQDAWSRLGMDPIGFFQDEVQTIGVGWSVANNGPSAPIYTATSLSRISNISLHPKNQAGGEGPTPLASPDVRRLSLGVTCLDYAYSMVAFSYSGPDFVIKIGSSEEVNIGNIHTGLQELYIESEGPDLDFAGNDSVVLELLSERPSTVPFPVFYTSGLQAGVRVGWAWAYCDLPEIMGAGELTAPTPTVSAAAEQEE